MTFRDLPCPFYAKSTLNDPHQWPVATHGKLDPSVRQKKFAKVGERQLSEMDPSNPLNIVWPLSPHDVISESGCPLSNEYLSLVSVLCGNGIEKIWRFQEIVCPSPRYFHEWSLVAICYGLQNRLGNIHCFLKVRQHQLQLLVIWWL